MENQRELAEELMEMIKLASGKSYKEILYLFAIKSAEISGADRVCLIIQNLKKQLVIKAGFPAGAHPVNQIIISEFGESFLKQVIGYRKYVLVNSPAINSKTSYMRELAKFRNITSILFMPLYREDEPLGLLVFDFLNGKRIGKDNIRRILNLADLMAVTMSAEYEKRKEKEELRCSEKILALGENAARVAHSIRNPLVSIGGFAKKIKKIIDGLENIPSLAKEYLDIIISDAKNLEEIIKNITIFCVPVKLNKGYCNLNSFLRDDVYKFIQMNNFDNHCKCIFVLDKKLEYIQVCFDKDKLLLCFQDLLRNAIEAKASRIIIKTKLKPKKEEVNIFLSNNGIGIDPEIKKEIFLPFVSTKTDGTGLGLANARVIIDIHGGKIKLEDHPCLTLFKLSLPINHGPC